MASTADIVVTERVCADMRAAGGGMPAARDYIAQAYLGQWGSAQTIERARNRIHWLGRHVTGTRVLEVGCSEGILALLLAREGFEVTGVDVNGEAIAFASNLLEKEREEVRQRVRFVCANITLLDPPQDRFDCVLIGEVLEHVVNPPAFLAKCLRHVKPGGTCILTTPLGISPHADHKQTFVGSGLLRLLLPFMEIRHFSVADGYVRVVGQVREGIEALEPAALTGGLEKCERVCDAELLRCVLEQTESGLLEMQRGFWGQVSKLRQECERWQQQCENLQQQQRAAQEQSDRELASREERVNALETQLQQRQREAALLREQLERLQNDQQRTRQENEQLRAQLRQLTTANAAQAQELAARQRLLEEREQRLESLARQAELQRVELAGLKPRLEAAQREYRALRLKHQTEVGRLRSRLDRQNNQINYLKAELARQFQTVRYRVGDAFVSALEGPGGLIRLPVRLFKLFYQGLRQRRQRRCSEAPAAPIDNPASRNQTSGVAHTESGSARAADSCSLAGESKEDPASHARQLARTWLTPIVSAADGVRAGPVVAGILDTMSALTFGPECRLLSFAPHNWEHVLEQQPPQLLLVESAWQGNEKSWQYLVGEYAGQSRAALEGLVAWCRRRGIPTVFWNKEDPVHFAKFKGAARLVDFVCTTDANMLPAYRELTNGQARGLDVLMFAAQPRLHNPIAVGARSSAPCFAGSFYANRHVERRRQMEALLDAARPFGLVIYDRNHGSAAPDFRFPERFAGCVRGSLPYEEIIRVYKQHKVFLNVNSVTDSPTMFSRRVFELLACGTAVISTPSLGIEKVFGALVPVAEDQSQFAVLLERLLTDEDYRRDLVRRGRREVFARHTTRHRLRQIAELVGLNLFTDGQTQLSVLTSVADATAARRLIELLAAQSARPSAVYLLAQPGVDAVQVSEQLQGRLPGLRVEVHSGVADDFGPLLRRLDAGPNNWVACLDPANDYDQWYLEDLLQCTQFAQADVIGHASYRLREADGRVRRHVGTENDYGALVHPHACLIRAECLRGSGWKQTARAGRARLAELQSNGVRVYAADGEGVCLAACNEA